MKQLYRSDSRSVMAGVIGFVFGVGLWATSPFVTGGPEPWDAYAPYYYIALVVIGYLCAWVEPRLQWINLLAIIAGQQTFRALFLPHAWQPMGVFLLVLFTLVLSGLGGLLSLPKHRIDD